MDLTALSEEQILEFAENAKALKEKAKEIEAARRKKEEESERKKGSPSLAAAWKGRDAANARGRRATGVEWFDKLTDDEQLIEVARANLRAYGSIVPPSGATLAALDKQCPECGKTKSVLSGFGVRTYKNGTIKPQAWCRDCRSGSTVTQSQRKPSTRRSRK